MSEFKVNLTVKIKASDGYQATNLVNGAIREGVREGLVLSGQVTGEPEECLCLTVSELNARIADAVREATGTATTPASA